jgi:hypothetical protein
MRKGFLLLAVLLTLSGVIWAQDVEFFCGDLNNADCDLLKESSATMSLLESAVFHFDFEFGFADDSSLFGQGFNFRLVGDGSFLLDAAILEELNNNAEAMQNNPTLMAEMMQRAVQSISADMTVILEIPEEFASLMSTSSASIPSRIPFDLRLVDGFGYINLDKIAELDRSGQLEGGWYGLDIAGLYRAFLEVTPTTPQTQPPITNFSDFDSQFATLERIDDAEKAGQTLAVFHADYDIAAILQDPTFADAFKEGFAESMRAQGFTAREAERMAEQSIALFETMTLAIRQSVGTEDKYLHNMTINFTWTPDMNALMAMAGAPGGSGFGSMDLEFTLDLSVDLSQFNDAPRAEAPENATIIPLRMLLPFLVQGGQT